ncbi:hypothetical protein BV25DRAFT_1911958 [Artomyces pyxidatus]|uniref:Uncharacterized protein n=1 Tax=Artomyces pyxidatus TaxID=48021 RepID=A0ACB8TFV0_9AGAM|nr:hypothetical protein BV25DRAFT_1911958 [Artomyces pyxidatus]
MTPTPSRYSSVHIMASSLSVQHCFDIILHIVRATPGDLVLHYDIITGLVAVWWWPLDERGVPIAPPLLEQYRQSHDILWPCCFCAVGGDYEESVIALQFSGHYRGYYTATCADPEGGCGYEVCLERPFRFRSRTRHYPLRPVTAELPDADAHEQLTQARTSESVVASPGLEQ